MIFSRSEKVVVRVAVEQRADGHHHQPFLAVGDEDPGVNRADRLLLVFRPMRAQRIITPSVLGSVTLVANLVRT